jgi:hypothetical protein
LSCKIGSIMNSKQQVRCVFTVAKAISYAISKIVCDTSRCTQYVSHSVGTVCSRSQATEFSLVLVLSILQRDLLVFINSSSIVPTNSTTCSQNQSHHTFPESGHLWHNAILCAVIIRTIATITAPTVSTITIDIVTSPLVLSH